MEFSILGWRTPSIFLLTILVLFVQGCSPTVASLDDEDSNSQQTLVPTQPEVKSYSEADSGPNPLSPGGAPGLGQMNPAEIEDLLADMSPEEQTVVTLRFWSITLLFFYSVYDRYPTSEEGLAILTNPPPAPNGKSYKPFGREILLTDGWGNPFVYRPITTGDNLPFFELKSLGPDGVPSEDDMIPDLQEVAMEASATITAGGLDEMDSN